MNKLKNEGALIQLNLYNELFNVFNSEKIDLFIKKLNDSEFKNDPLVRNMVDELNSIKFLYNASNRLPKWAPVPLASFFTIIGHMNNFLMVISTFSQDARGEEKENA